MRALRSPRSSGERMLKNKLADSNNEAERRRVSFNRGIVVHMYSRSEEAIAHK
jgi:hypothetical protein